MGDVPQIGVTLTCLRALLENSLPLDGRELCPGVTSPWVCFRTLVLLRPGQCRLHPLCKMPSSSPPTCGSPNHAWLLPLAGEVRSKNPCPGGALRGGFTSRGILASSSLLLSSWPSRPVTCQEFDLSCSGFCLQRCNICKYIDPRGPIAQTSLPLKLKTNKIKELNKSNKYVK